MEILATPKLNLDREKDYKIVRDDLGVFEDFIEEVGIEERNLDFFFNNIKDVNIYLDQKKYLFKKVDPGNYLAALNSIFSTQDLYKVGIMHEIFHMASTYVTSDRIYCGFSQEDENLKSIGTGLTEGYTAILDERYFPDYDPRKRRMVGTTYPILKLVVSHLETAVGNLEMEDLYFRADLKTLYEYLSMIMGEKRTYHFIRNIDRIYYYCDGQERLNFDKTCKAYHECMLYLGELQLKLVYRTYRRGNMEEELYQKNLERIDKLLSSELCFGKSKKFKVKNKYQTTEEEKKLIFTRSTRHYTTLN